MNAEYACVNFWRAMLDCHCYGQHSHENESRTEIRREPFIRAVLVLDIHMVQFASNLRRVLFKTRLIQDTFYARRFLFFLV